MISPHGTQDIPHIYHDIPHGTEHPHGTQDIPHGTHDIPHGTEHPHSTAHTLYRVILWRNVQTRGLQQFINLNEIFDGQEQQSNSNICLNQEIQYTFISSWNCDCSLWLKVKSFNENLWKQNLSKQKHHMLLLFRWFLEHHAISCWWLVSCIVSSMA